MLRYLVDKVKSAFKPKPVKHSSTVQGTGESFPTPEQLVQEMIQGGVIDHDKLNKVCNLYFGVAIKKSYFKLKGHSQYGVLLTIDAVDFITGDSGKLKDVLITLRDEGLNSSLCIKLSVKEFHEFLVSVEFKKPAKKESSV